MQTFAEQRTCTTPKVEVLREGLPDFMLAAQKAIEQGRLDEARMLLDERAERQLKELMDNVSLRIDAMLMMGLMLLRIQAYERSLYWFKRVTEHIPHAVAYQQLRFPIDVFIHVVRAPGLHLVGPGQDRLGTQRFGHQLKGK